MSPSMSPSVSPSLRRFVPVGLACALLLSCLTALGTTAAVGRGGGSASLSVSPRVYVGGQSLKWTGNVGHRGVRRLILQFNMGRVWSDVAGFSSRTERNGSFSFRHPAPSMMNIRYRVKAGPYVTPARRFAAKTQDLTIRLKGTPANNINLPAAVSPGESFGITVDTTPDNIMRSPDTQGLPVFEGRRLTLQKRRHNGSWRSVDRRRVGADGQASFGGLHERAGVKVYRVKQGDYTKGAHRIGWIASFPLYVLSGARAQAWYADLHGANQPSASLPPPGGGLGPQPPTASQRYRWVPSYFDFAWEYGQSLSSPPARGTRIKGHWQEYSDGAGRVAKYNGGLAIDSKRFVGAGRGDFGTTMATLRGNAMTHGRWETSLRFRNAFEKTGHPFTWRAELVPARASDYDCGAHTITIADLTPFSRTLRYGVRNRQHSWKGSKRAPEVPRGSVWNVAVEVAGDHITWFLDSKPIGSVSSSKAVPGVPLTFRLSARGRGNKEMDQAGLISDWQRGFPIDTGSQQTSDHRLRRQDAGRPDCSLP